MVTRPWEAAINEHSPAEAPRVMLPTHPLLKSPLHPKQTILNTTQSGHKVFSMQRMQMKPGHIYRTTVTKQERCFRGRDHKNHP